MVFENNSHNKEKTSQVLIPRYKPLFCILGLSTKGCKYDENFSSSFSLFIIIILMSVNRNGVKY